MTILTTPKLPCATLLSRLGGCRVLEAVEGCFFLPVPCWHRQKKSHRIILRVADTPHAPHRTATSHSTTAEAAPTEHKKRILWSARPFTLMTLRYESCSPVYFPTIAMRTGVVTSSTQLAKRSHLAISGGDVNREKPSCRWKMLCRFYARRQQSEHKKQSEHNNHRKHNKHRKRGGRRKRTERAQKNFSRRSTKRAG